MTVREQIIDYLHTDERFYHHGKTVTDFFMSWEKGDKYQGDFLDLKKSHSGKTLAKAQILVFTNDCEEVELKVELYLNSYLEWETFFEGWVENLDEFKTVLKMVGL